jgi:two-component system response regulator FixJ
MFECREWAASSYNGLNSLGFKLPIIVMTLKGDMETAVRAMKGGAVDFSWKKPFNDEGTPGRDQRRALPLGPARDSESTAAAQRVVGLSPRERQVDTLIARALDQADGLRSRHQPTDG